MPETFEAILAKHKYHMSNASGHGSVTIIDFKFDEVRKAFVTRYADDRTNHASIRIKDSSMMGYKITQFNTPEELDRYLSS